MKSLFINVMEYTQVPTHINFIYTSVSNKNSYCYYEPAKIRHDDSSLLSILYYDIVSLEDACLKAYVPGLLHTH